MSKFLIDTQSKIKSALICAIESGIENGDFPKAEIPDFNVEIPAESKNGDFASNCAMVCAKVFRNSPMNIAKIICSNFNTDGIPLEKFETAGAGFINFYLSSAYYATVLREVLTEGKHYGSSDHGKGKKINVEFVSANPTGPMHMGNARGGALGDCLAAVLEKAGYEVEREFYINDAGNQIAKFGLSLSVRYLSLFLPADDERCILPDDSYHGEDILTLAKEFAALNSDKFVSATPDERESALIDFALPKNIDSMKKLMAKYRIHYDTWFPESELHKGEISEIIDLLADKGLTYENDGALWYKATAFGAEKDEVLIRSNGTATYFAADIAYHRNKLSKRGFDKAIDVWGADHHGHVARLKCALEAVGEESDKLDVILMQLVRLVKNGETVKMSKRTGKSITLEDLLNEIPVDAVRFLFNMREASSQMDFDLDLALEQSAKNPVYYVQYAHARICSILKKLAADGIEPRVCTAAELERLDSAEERAIIRHLASYTSEIITSADSYDPARITRFVTELATLFHKFYNSKRVAVTSDENLMQARISLCMAVRDTIENILKMFKISAPDTM